MGRVRLGEEKNQASMPSLTLVSASRPLAAKAMPARELYLSRWFRLGCAVAESRGEWRVLSTQHGLLTPDVVLAPYEPLRPRVAWYDEVVRALLELTQPGDTVTLLSSNQQGEPLRHRLREAGRNWAEPMEGWSLSQQVAWLEEELQRAGLAVPGSRQRTDEEKRARRERRAARRG